MAEKIKYNSMNTEPNGNSPKIGEFSEILNKNSRKKNERLPAKSMHGNDFKYHGCSGTCRGI